jgi:hypothetical protein
MKDRRWKPRDRLWSLIGGYPHRLLLRPALGSIPCVAGMASERLTSY